MVKRILQLFLLLLLINSQLLFSQNTGDESIAVGQEAPKIVLPDINNEYVYVSDFCGKTLRKPYKNKTKHVVVLSFFATWCKPCIAEIPHLQNLREKFRGKPVKFYLVNVGEERELIQKFKQQKNVGLPILMDRFKKTAEKFDALTLPRLFVLGKNGKIQYESRGFSNPQQFEQDLENKITALLEHK